MRTDDLGRDVRQCVRSMRSAPLFTAVALLTLTLGIGANTAIFTIVNGVLLRPLDYPHPDRLMALDAGAFGLAPAEYFEFRTINRSFAAVGAYTTKDVNVGARRAVRARAVFADGQLFDALELR